MRIPCRTAHAATEGRGGVFRTKAMPAARLGAERSPAPDHAAATARQPARHRRTDTCASTAMLGPARRQRTASTAKTPGTASSTVRTCLFVRLLGHMPREAAMRRTDPRGRDVLRQHVEALCSGTSLYTGRRGFAWLVTTGDDQPVPAWYYRGTLRAHAAATPGRRPPSQSRHR
jgi:hypothetical protein